ncbi:MAG: nucleotidyltransferase family protein [Bacteroidia bacterium]|nr:nucleotidyltransferase family protein [Winogradskyella sp.]MBT8375650.1 nucleotidyltransferase family protein [Bacteroidia bacterium]NNL83995.1 hypothetical protein [Winogradskyella sp.]
MASRLTTYQLIADILSFESDQNDLEERLSHAQTDWDAVVTEGSRHLILPALYCSLKAKSLLHLLPNDLVTYLEEITTINRNRNQSILEQIQFISKVFTAHTIDHVFLKGSAMLVSGYYTDIAERMIGDIDILIAQNQLNDAFVLLQQHNFSHRDMTFGSTYIDNKHLPALTSQSYISSVELHQRLFMGKANFGLRSEAILKRKVTNAGISIPCDDDLLHHNILNYQINDSGYLRNTISFRTVYDHLVLTKHTAISNKMPNNKYMFAFNAVSSQLFPHLNTDTNFYFKMRRYFFRLKLKYTRLDTLWRYWVKWMLLLKLFWSRTKLSIKNSNYRKELWRDKKRIYTLIKTKLND